MQRAPPMLVTLAVLLGSASALWAGPGGPASSGIRFVPVYSQARDNVQIWRPLFIPDGKLLVVDVAAGAPCNAIEVAWMGQRFSPEPVPRGRCQALLPVPLGVKTGKKRLVIHTPEGRVPFRIPVTRLKPMLEPSERPRKPSWSFKVAKRFVNRTPPRRTRSESAALGAALRASGNARLWSEPFLRPAAGPETSAFGCQRVFNGVLTSLHRGLDLDGTNRDPVYASNAGVVRLVANDFFYVGNAVVIDHGQGLFTTYFHLSRLFVETGQRVERGQLLGTIGATGRVTGPHLHFGVKLAGQYIDPRSLMRFQPGAPLPEALLAEDDRPERVPPLYAEAP